MMADICKYHGMKTRKKTAYSIRCMCCLLPVSRPPRARKGGPWQLSSGCGNTSAIIGGPDGTPLQNSIRYWVAVIAFDDWGNGI